MLHKTLAEEQADMRLRWGDPAYRWQNDSELRKRYLKEAQRDTKKERPNNWQVPKNTRV